MKIKLSKNQWERIGKKAGWMKKANLVTNKDIEYEVAPYGFIANIPKGTSVIPATNLPEGGYWAEPWEGMNNKATSWERNYGFHVEDTDIEDLGENSPKAMSLVERAEELGRKAFQSGMMAASALDKDFIKMLRGNEVGEAIQLLEAWSRGWHKANLEN